MKLVIEKSVTVITPTILSSKLSDAIESVQAQTYKNINHLIVVDGEEHKSKMPRLGIKNVKFMVLPYNTGANGFYGHRIYAGLPHLINSEYIAFLDEDNWYEPNHIETLVNKLESNKLDWVYSLRKIYTKDKEFVADDCCESLGRWPIFWSINKEPQYLVDTSAYLFKTSFLTQVCNHWHSGWGGDRRFFHILTKVLGHQNFDTTGQHTLCYRLDDSIEKKYGDISFFEKGNEVVKTHNRGKFPWL
jgi:glycosyltransferase involved in cell wall biosynthesis